MDKTPEEIEQFHHGISESMTDSGARALGYAGIGCFCLLAAIVILIILFH